MPWQLLTILRSLSFSEVPLGAKNTAFQCKGAFFRVPLRSGEPSRYTFALLFTSSAPSELVSSPYQQETVTQRKQSFPRRLGISSSRTRSTSEDALSIQGAFGRNLGTKKRQSSRQPSSSSPLFRRMIYLHPVTVVVTIYGS